MALLIKNTKRVDMKSKAIIVSGRTMRYNKNGDVDLWINYYQ